MMDCENKIKIYDGRKQKHLLMENEVIIDICVWQSETTGIKRYNWVVSQQCRVLLLFKQRYFCVHVQLHVFILFDLFSLLCLQVGYDTINSSEDQILKQDMPPALHRVEDASVLLLEASDMLRDDPFSAPARKKLIEGSRGWIFKI